MTQTKHKKVLMITGSLVIAAICLATIFGAQQLLKTWKARSGTLHAKKMLVVSIDLSQREKFFEQFTRFAAAHDFKIHIGPTTPAGDTFSIYMSRKDVLIWGGNAFSPKEYDIDFYDKSPTNPVSEEIIDDLFNDLKRYMSEVPNTILTEQRKSLTITIDESQREELFAQMRKLADEHSLEFTISFSSDKTLFHLEIHGEGFHLTSEPAVGSPKEISTVFFIDYHQAPASASLETVDQLSNELKSRVGEIPNATVTEEQ